MATVAGFATALPADFTPIANNQVNGSLVKIAASALDVHDGVLPSLTSVETDGNTFRMRFDYSGTSMWCRVVVTKEGKLQNFGCVL